MNKICFMYAGQGSQIVGMGQDIYNKYPIFKKNIDEIELDFDIKNKMFYSSEIELSKTEYTQPCMAAFACAITELLKDNNIYPEGAIGLSLGEFGALYAAGVLDKNQYLKITSFRGKIMSEAEDNNFELRAVFGLDSSVIEQICKELRQEGFIDLTNYNCKGQYVICAETAIIDKAGKIFEKLGAKRYQKLNVSAPFHTEKFSYASEKLANYFESMNFNEPSIPVALNITGKLLNKNEDIKSLMSSQVKSAIHFEDCAKTMIDEEFNTFIEIGPGKTLSSFIKKTATEMGKKINVFNIQYSEDVEKVVSIFNQKNI